MEILERVKRRDFISMDWGHIKASIVVCDRQHERGSQYELLVECVSAEEIHPLIKGQTVVTRAPHTHTGFLDINVEFNNLTVYDLEEQVADCVDGILKKLYKANYAPLV